MDEIIVTFNTAFSGLFALFLMWAVLSRRVKDGVIIKAGMICMAFGFLAKVPSLYDGFQRSDMIGLTRANGLIHVGIIIVVLGYVVRTKAGAMKQRRRTDWVGLDGEHHVERRRT